MTAAAADRLLDRADLRTLGLAALGGALEFYDFVIFVFFAVTIGTLFFRPTRPNGCASCRPTACLPPATWRVRSAAS